MIDRINSREIPLRQQQIIYEILAQTNESAIHRMRGEKENRVFTNKKTGQEVVFDEHGDRVENGYNDGTYNYANEDTEPLLHFIMDTSPWIMKGISEQDPTSVGERIYAYMGDLEGGLVRAQQTSPFPPLPDTHLWPKTGQLQALAIFIKAIEAGEAQELFDLVEQNQPISDEQIIRVLTKLNHGLDIVYGAQQSP